MKKIKVNPRWLLPTVASVVFVVAMFFIVLQFDVFGREGDAHTSIEFYQISDVEGFLQFLYEYQDGLFEINIEEAKEYLYEIMVTDHLRSAYLEDFDYLIDALGANFPFFDYIEEHARITRERLESFFHLNDMFFYIFLRAEFFRATLGPILPETSFFIKGVSLPSMWPIDDFDKYIQSDNFLLAVELFSLDLYTPTYVILPNTGMVIFYTSNTACCP